MVIKSGYFLCNAKSFMIKNKTKSCTQHQMELFVCRIYCRCKKFRSYMEKFYFYFSANKCTHQHNFQLPHHLCLGCCEIIFHIFFKKTLSRGLFRVFPSFCHQIFLKYFVHHSSLRRFHRQTSSLLLAFLIAYFSFELNEGKFPELFFSLFSKPFCLFLILHSFATFVNFLNLFLAHHSLK